MNNTSAALVAGVVAGFGIAMPLGAIGVLIVHEGLTRGWRSAAAAASGTALVDLGYVCLALVAGAAVTDRLQGYTRAVQLVGAAVLVAVVARGLAALRRTALPVGGPPAHQPVQDHELVQDPRKGGGGGRGRGGGEGGGAAWRTLRRFVGLTAINPLTAVYFVVLTAGLSRTVHGGGAGAAFAVGVFAASWSWQLMLAAVGTAAGARLPGWARTATSLTGYLVVLGYAGRLALGG